MGKSATKRTMKNKFNKRQNVPIKKFNRGEAVRFITRARAMRKLQVSLRTFRRLCILKGIYPVQPNNEKQANKGKGVKTTFYLSKDIRFLAREPLLKKFLEQRIFVKKIKKALGRREFDRANDLDERYPKTTLDHLVFERYPLFDMALNDMDDALSAIFLFATYPPNHTLSAKLVHMCQRLAAEFFNYVIYSRSLKKVFISIKGYYYEVEINGKKIVWIQPHQFTQPKPRLVDFRVMRTFLDFYVYLIGFINFKLFQSINLVYPPKLVNADSELETEYLTAFSSHLCKLADVQTEEVELDAFEETGEALKQQNEELEREKKFKSLFAECKFFVSREVPREQFAFVIRCFGGQVSWSETQGLGSTYQESDPSITHQIIDRPVTSQRKLSRFYVQPQWIFDSVNAQKLLPMEPYFPGKILPPHVSPFTTDTNAVSYIPAESKILAHKMANESLKKSNKLTEIDDSDIGESSSDEDEVTQNDLKSQAKAETTKPEVTPGKKVGDKKTDFPENHDKELLAKQLPRNRRWFYATSIRKEKEDKDRVENLKRKRKIVESTKKKNEKLKKASNV